ncbi:MAG: DUF2723 domain-containing protein [Bacteroidales bacterium]|nr:DUF2723 domain-containing protein [Bacteroidales bacterium]
MNLQKNIISSCPKTFCSVFGVFLQRLVKIGAWLAFALSFIAYLMSMSLNVNFWDCGEIITCAHGLQIGHPPGAPFYMILARIFSMFAFNSENIAFFVNLLSVFSCSFAVFFTYKSIIILLKRFKSEKTDVKNDLLLSGAAFIGAIALAFSTSFWFIATEAEVYSLSIFFTSLTVWTMLKTTSLSEKSDKNRWILLTILLLGISTGVHLLNILVIPAFVFIFYFDRKTQNKKELAKFSVYAILMLILAQGIITYLPVIASKFEWFFVNRLYLGYNLGLLAFGIFLCAIFIFGIWYSGKKGKKTLNFAITGLMFFIMGFSIYSTVLIRSAANPPIDENNPESIFNFVSYLNREQYGDRPLWYGQQFNSKKDKINPYVEGVPIYDTVSGKYEIVSYKPEANYMSSDKVLLPRMWSDLPEHVAAYRQWTNYKKDEIPSFGDNMKFMFRYQFNHMYFRYLFRNFIGAQNDIQSHGGPVYGNWISGIGFIDKLRLNTPDELPASLKNDASRNPYYFLPFIFGIIGLIYLFQKDKKYFLVSLLLFVFTGIAIAFYLNQHPYQARERDYSYVGSFYVFALWIGIGVYATYQYLKKYFKKKYLIYLLLTFAFLAVPFQFLCTNFDDHNRRHDDFAYYFAYNMLNSCADNAILFTAGDNETFPLWYLQETQNIRTDVKIVNLSFLNTSWYLDQIQRKQRNTNPVNISVSPKGYMSGQRELLPVKNNPYAFIEDIYYQNINEINADYQTIFNFLLDLWHTNGFDKMHPDKYDNFVNFYSDIQPHGADQNFRDLYSVIESLNNEEQCEAFGISQTQALDLIRKFKAFLDKQTSYALPLHPVLNFVFSDDEVTKIGTKLYSYPIDYFPATAFLLPVNKNIIDEVFELSPSEKTFVVDKMVWSPGRESFTKSDLMVLEIIRNHLWDRPIYFSSTMNPRNYLGLDKYLYLEGFTYRLMPIETDVSEDKLVNVNAEIMYHNLIDKFKWGSLEAKSRPSDMVTRTSLINLRNHFARLARGLYFKGEIEKSNEVLDMCVELIPNDLIPFDYYIVGIVHGYYRINQKAKAREIASILSQNALQELVFYASFNRQQQAALDIYKQRAMQTIQELYVLANQYKHREFTEEIDDVYEKAAKIYTGSK